MTASSMKAATDLYSKYKDQNFECHGYPSGEFANQSPENDEQTKEACGRMKADFPLFKKIEVNGDNACPIWTYLRKNKPGFLGTESIKWNFTSFLVDHEGKIVERFSPGINYNDVEKELVPVLKRREEAFQKSAENGSTTPTSLVQQPSEVTSVVVVSEGEQQHQHHHKPEEEEKPQSKTPPARQQSPLQQQQHTDSGMIENPPRQEKVKNGGCCA
jgi:glutathione peroxidase